jgi:hypothetical protein
MSLSAMAVCLLLVQVEESGLVRLSTQVYTFEAVYAKLCGKRKLGRFSLGRVLPTAQYHNNNGTSWCAGDLWSSPFDFAAL